MRCITPRVLEHTLLKPSMVVPGKEHAQQHPAEVAAQTIRVLRRTVPAAVPGIVFLSGGQTPGKRRQSRCITGRSTALALSFSYGRALQEPPCRLEGQATHMRNAQKHCSSAPD